VLRITLARAPQRSQRARHTGTKKDETYFLYTLFFRKYLGQDEFEEEWVNSLLHKRLWPNRGALQAAKARSDSRPAIWMADDKPTCRDEAVRLRGSLIRKINV
jgi:hypothetical protein